MKKAFTLIELLVVITIIGILIGILLPIITRSHQVRQRPPQVQGSCVGTVVLVSENDRGGWIAELEPVNGHRFNILIPADRPELTETMKRAMREHKPVEISFTEDQNGYSANALNSLN